MLRKTLLAACLGFSHWLSAATYNLPTDGSNMVGTLQYHSVVAGETMSDIAKQYDVGFLSLMAANKGVDPFLPKEGYVLTIPSQAILPHVDYKGIVINLAELRLYYFEPDKSLVHIFPVGIGRIGQDTPEMTTKISQLREAPTWTPPTSIRKEYLAKGVELPKVVPAGPENPLGDYAMRLAYGTGSYLIHGTNKDFGIGLRVSAGCIRMDPKDIDWLFHQAKVGMQVRIIDEPIKIALEPDRSVFIEAHEPLTRSDGTKKEMDIPQELTWWLDEYGINDRIARAAVLAQNGVPIEVVPAMDDLE
ncbi:MULTISPECIES: L,D-transpeptidase family protein [Vibrio]|jgi:L,D-transpeptidase YcfS|uniref:L,D-transpeptidase family protein n=1 Tax=Vibrio barjaei TaxID=1676683 RepID=A0ABW7IMD5_9VIBR|nr:MULTISPECIES: L,D-transpeptidase family protein [Vibrio]MCY9872619.1 L,D-transpeptidase family protein [Vibrio barjaei]